jgi:hypothetical protein
MLALLSPLLDLGESNRITVVSLLWYILMFLDTGGK